MRAVAKDLIDVEISDEIIKTLQDEFFRVMRKHGICEGEFVENGRVVANPEWTMCKTLFFNMIEDALQMAFFFAAPKDLEAYPIKED